MHHYVEDTVQSDCTAEGRPQEHVGHRRRVRTQEHVHCESPDPYKQGQDSDIRNGKSSYFPSGHYRLQSCCTRYLSHGCPILTTYDLSTSVALRMRATESTGL